MRRHRLLIVAVTLICAAAAFGVSALQKKTYSATASLAVSDPNQGLNLLGGGYLSGQTPLQLASAATPQVTRPEVVNRVRQNLHSLLSTSALRAAVSVAIDPNSYLVLISADARDGGRAARIANAFASADASLTNAETRAQFHAQALAVKRQLQHAPASVQVTTADTLARLQNLSSVATPLQVSALASPPSSPSSPKPARNTLAALLFGLFLGIALAVARDALDRRLRHSGDVSAVLEHPVVGHIRSEALGHAGVSNISGTDKTGPLSDIDEESFRILRENIRYLAAASDMRTILVTSGMAQEGKSTVAACLAAATAEAGRRTLLVECDLRRPVLAERVGIQRSPGLTDYLTGNAEPHDILQPVSWVADGRNGNGAGPASGADHNNLVCITSGTPVPRPAELLASERFHAFLHEVGQVYDAVILDTAPLLPVADTLGIIPDVAALLVCVRLNQTTRDEARATKAALERLPERAVGLVLTDIKDKEEGYYGGYYGAYPTSTPVPSPATG